MSVYAATDGFVIKTQIGSDTTPPTVPQNLTATPVATSQIDLAWDASTDSFGIAGYQVFRDDAQIATTSLTTFSDTGLLEGTLYSYYVTAFDNSGLVSASSTVVATTTLATPPPPPPPSEAGVAPRIELEAPPVALISLEIVPGTTDVVIVWQTNGFVRSILKWGETLSYEGGSIAEQSFRKYHETRISGLTQDTKYYFTIEGENGTGAYAVLTTSSFKTLSDPKTFVPQNVGDLRAVKNGPDIMLTWNNPDDAYFDRVRILSSHLFYPSDTADGALVYEGKEQSAVEKGVALPGTTRYYTAFTYDIYGNISSGAVVAITINDDGTIIIKDPDSIPTEEGGGTLDVTDILFEQDGVLLGEEEEGMITIDGSKQLRISIPYELVPEHLKVILMTIYKDGSKESQFTFLLRINETRTHYTAVLAPFGISGQFPFSLSIFDYETRKIVSTSGTLASEIIFPVKEPVERAVLTWRSVFGFVPEFVLLLLLLLLIAYYAIVRDRSTAV